MSDKETIRAMLATLIIVVLLVSGLGLVFDKETNHQIKKVTANAGFDGKGGSLDGANVSAQYLYEDGTYCGGHGLTICVNKLWNSEAEKIPDSVGSPSVRKQETTYTHDRTTEMAQSIAFALWSIGEVKPIIQDLIWASNQWTAYIASCLEPRTEETGPYPAGNDSIQNRASKFANFAYKALRNRNTAIAIRVLYKR